MQRLTRRDMVRGTTLALAGAALAGPTAFAAANAQRPHTPSATGSHAAVKRAEDVPEAFDEMYLGRHIEGWPATEGEDGHGDHGDGGDHGEGFVVRVDDDDLHVMQNADGTWISVINHYETHRTPRSAARAAVRELHGATLVPVTV